MTRVIDVTDAPRCVVCDDPVPLPADGPAPLTCATCEVAS